MSAAVLSCLIFALTLGGIVLGALLRTTLPQHHLSKDSQDVVRLGVGLIATIAALVLGLLIAAAKGSFDTQSGQIRQITADGKCRVGWIVETPGSRGPNYAVHAQCESNGQAARADVVNMILRPEGGDRVSIGKSFTDLKPYLRCP